MSDPDTAARGGGGTVAEAPRGRSDATAERDDESDAAVADATLLKAVIDRAPRALDAFYDRFARRAYGLARRICVDETLAEEVVQEVFLQVWRQPDRFDASRGSVATWLMTMVHHRAVDAVRRESTRRRHTVPPAEDGDEWGAQDRSGSEPGADEAALERVVAGHVRDALGELPPEQREALTLAYFGGFTQREVASIANVPLGTVKSRMFTAVRTLRGLLDGRVDRGEGTA